MLYCCDTCLSTGYLIASYTFNEDAPVLWFPRFTQQTALERVVGQESFNSTCDALTSKSIMGNFKVPSIIFTGMFCVHIYFIIVYKEQSIAGKNKGGRAPVNQVEYSRQQLLNLQNAKGWNT